MCFICVPSFQIVLEVRFSPRIVLSAGETTLGVASKTKHMHTQFCFISLRFLNLIQFAQSPGNRAFQDNCSRFLLGRS